MAIEADFEFEKFEEYFGDAKQVRKIMNHCTACGGKLIHSHLSDYKNLVVQEHKRCPECGNTNKKKIHIIN